MASTAVEPFLIHVAVHTKTSIHGTHNQDWVYGTMSARLSYAGSAQYCNVKQIQTIYLVKSWDISAENNQFATAAHSTTCVFKSLSMIIVNIWNETRDIPFATYPLILKMSVKVFNVCVFKDILSAI